MNLTTNWNDGVDELLDIVDLPSLRIKQIKQDLTQLHEAAVREELVEEWNLIHETLHSATIVAELHINEVTNDRIAALQGKKGEE